MKVTLLAILFLWSLTGNVWGQGTMGGNTGDAVFDPVIELNQTPSGPTLLGGVPANTDDWPASFYSPAEKAVCGATLVGPEVLLTAAHCVGNQAKATIRYKDGRRFRGICTHADKYLKDKTADYALCRMKPRIDGIVYETVNRNPNLVRRNSEILLTGYGCTKKDPTPKGIDKIFRTGSVTVKVIPAINNQYPNSYESQGEVAVCFGDSGSAGFWVDVNSADRKVVAVNSTGNIEDRSWLSSTSTQVAQDFFEKWQTDNDNALICGVSPKIVTDCR